MTPRPTRSPTRAGVADPTAAHERALRFVAAALVTAAGAVHLEQWIALFSAVPKLGPLFLANVVVSGLVALALVARRDLLSLLGAAAVAGGTLLAFLAARYGGLLGYQEASWRSPAVAAALLEGAALLILTAAALLYHRRALLAQLR